MEKTLQPARTTADFNVTPLNVDVKLDVGSEITKDSTITISAPGATGEIIVIVDDEVKTLPLVDGNAIYSLENTSYGDHNLVVIYNGVVSHVTQFTIEKLDVDITASADPIDVGDVVEIIVTLNETAKGSVVVDGKYYGEINEGQAIISISGLANGTHTFTVKYSGDEKYPAKTVTGEITVDANINIPDEVPYNDGEITISLPSDATGNVTVTIDDETNVTVPVVNGTARIPLDNLSMGDHKITATYSGDDDYKKSSVFPLEKPKQIY